MQTAFPSINSHMSMYEAIRWSVYRFLSRKSTLLALNCYLRTNYDFLKVCLWITKLNITSQTRREVFLNMRALKIRKMGLGGGDIWFNELTIKHKGLIEIYFYMNWLHVKFKTFPKCISLHNLFDGFSL